MPHTLVDQIRLVSGIIMLPLAGATVYYLWWASKLVVGKHFKRRVWLIMALTILILSFLATPTFLRSGLHVPPVIPGILGGPEINFPALLIPFLFAAYFATADAALRGVRQYGSVSKQMNSWERNRRFLLFVFGAILVSSTINTLFFGLIIVIALLNNLAVLVSLAYTAISLLRARRNTFDRALRQHLKNLVGFIFCVEASRWIGVGIWALIVPFFLGYSTSPVPPPIFPQPWVSIAQVALYGLTAYQAYRTARSLVPTVKFEKGTP